MMDGCNSAHRRLSIRLSKEFRVAMMDKYRTTKANPVCNDIDLKMKRPEGGNITVECK